MRKNIECGDLKDCLRVRARQNVQEYLLKNYEREAAEGAAAAKKKRILCAAGRRKLLHVLFAIAFNYYYVY